MTIFKKLIKKIREYYTGEPDNLMIVIDAKTDIRPERYYDMIKRSFKETGFFTVQSANCLPIILGDKNHFVVTEHFNVDPPFAMKYGWSDISEIVAWWNEDRTKYTIKFTCPPYSISPERDFSKTIEKWNGINHEPV